jgi:signal transduction histidine kinase
MERATGDLLLRLSTTDQNGPVPVVCILIDDRSVDRFGPLPWPRDRLAKLITTAGLSGAGGVVVDLILAQGSSTELDLSLAEAVSTVPTVLAAAFDSEGAWLLPAPEIGGVRAAAHAYGEVGPDGVVRTVAATKQGHGLSLPALSLAAARILEPDLAIGAGVELRPEFRPAPQSIPGISAADILESTFNHQGIAEKIVLIGVSATGAGDQFVVPTGPRHAPVAGVLAHASATVSILRGRLLKSVDAWWSLVALFVLALGVQVIRDRRGSFDFAAFAGLVTGLVLIAALAIRFGLLMIPVTTLLVAAVTSALLREAYESRIAQRESGRLLQAVLEHVGGPSSPVPRTAGGRLDALRHLQERVLEEDDTRKALLEGMNEGVVLWDRQGRVILANSTADTLWGGLPDPVELAESTSAGQPSVITRGLRHLAVALTDLESGRLAIIRDVSAEHALERRRHEMQRLVSHELKTPLASIAGFGESLERYDLSGDEQKRVASLIRGEAERLNEMVTVFLDLERLGGGHWEGAAEDVDLGNLVGKRLEILEAAASSSNLEIRASVDDGCRVRGVPALLERVIDNIVGNAIKYSPAGDRIEVDVRRARNRIEIDVRDQGPGISAEHVARIFDRFYRVPGSPGTGAGLGLALAKEVIDWHGGCITIDSESGAGSTFNVSMPASEEV